MAAPPLSVILCSHARPDYLRACLAGLAAQSCRDFELLVVDSASPPEAARVIATLAQGAGARHLRSDSPGLSRARNLGLAESRGDWVAYLDDDAVAEPGWAAALLARIAALPPRSAALGGRIMPAWEAPLPTWWPPKLRGVLTIVEWDGFGEVGRDLPAEVDIYGANMAFAAAPLRGVGGFPEALGRVGSRLLSGEEVEVVGRLRAGGYRAFYDGAAAVRHSIQQERLRPAWLLSRLLWQGATDALRDRRGRTGQDRTFGAAARLAVQAPLLLWPAASPVLLRARCGAAYNLGYLRGRLSSVPAVRLPRRALLVMPLAAALPAAPVTAQPTALRDRLAGLRLGANLERWYSIAKDNHPRRLGPSWWRDFRAAGFDHVRIFLPEVKQTSESPDVLEMFLQAVQDATGVGLPVLLGLADTFHHSDPWGERDWNALATRAAFFGSRTDPAQVVLAPLNEPAFPDTATWLPVRDRLLATIRRAAPHHVLMWGGREWCSYRSLLETAPPADPNTIAEVHDYLGGDAAAVEGRFGAVAAWRDRHRLPVLVTELGGAQGHETNVAAWAADLGRILPVLRRHRLPAALWSYSHGGWWRIQPDDQPRPRPEIRALIG